MFLEHSNEKILKYFQVQNQKMIGSVAKLAKTTGTFSSNSSTYRLMSSSARKTVTLIPGDGIGPEIAAAVQR